MKVIKNLGTKDLNNLIELWNGEIYTWGGSLIDNYIIENNNKEVDFKYAIFLETYKNCWSSDYTLTLTNDKAIFDKYYNIYYKELIKEDFNYDSTIEKIQEVGRLYLSEIDEDIELFIEALEEYTDNEYTIKNDTNGYYITEY